MGIPEVISVVSGGFAGLALLFTWLASRYSRGQVEAARKQTRQAQKKVETARGQVEQARRQIAAAAQESTSKLAFRLNQALLEVPLVSVNGHSNGSALTDGTEDKPSPVPIGADFFVDVLECIWERRDEYEAGDRETWREWIHDVFATSPAVSTRFLENPDWYPVLKNLRESKVCTSPVLHTFFSGGLPG